jgi:peptide/nickel transport system permease protein
LPSSSSGRSIAIFAPLVIPYPVGEIVDLDYFGPMSRELWLGSDYLGRDMLSRILMGARYTVGISLAAVTIACFSGVVLGMIAAVAGGWLDTILSRFLDALNSIPSKLFGLVVVAAVGSSVPVLIMTLSVIYIPGAYRFARALAVNINAMDFITVARIRGESTLYLIAPKSCPTSRTGACRPRPSVSSSSCCCFPGCPSSGLGVQPPYADWGALVRENIGGLPFGAPAVMFLHWRSPASPSASTC